MFNESITSFFMMSVLRLWTSQGRVCNAPQLKPVSPVLYFTKRKHFKNYEKCFLIT